MKSKPQASFEEKQLAAKQLAEKQLCFIGAGNMAGAIIKGLLDGGIDGKRIFATEKDEAFAQQRSAELGIQASVNYQPLVSQADVIILAVKPQILESACRAIAEHIRTDTLIISIAAGIKVSKILAWLNRELAIVRSMPNTPAAVAEGASGLFASASTSQAQQKVAEAILGAVSQTVWVDSEALIDAVTAVSGSGPAYFFLMLEAMVDAGAKLGLGREQARQLAIQTALGSAKLAQLSADEPAVLRKQVTSPQGTTAAAISHFEQADFKGLVEAAMLKCYQRAQELADDTP